MRRRFYGACIALLACPFVMAMAADEPIVSDVAAPVIAEPAPANAPSAALTKETVGSEVERCCTQYAQQLKKERAAEMKAKEIKVGEHVLKFDYRVIGDKPKNGRSLYLSMHGGGGAPKQVNDQQWQNQKRLYTPEEGVYLAPRAPGDTWNLWHTPQVDALFDRLIENLIVFEDVDPNRVYLMGYSAGGDGVYQLAPRMADRFAAASMMAGHPNNASPRGLRNLPFSIHMGAEDGAYSRNKVAAEWGEKLDALQKDDPQGYEHWVKLYAGKGHWMDREDAAAVPWMHKFTRNPLPKKVVWRQGNVPHPRFYWLAIDENLAKPETEVTAEIEGQTIQLTSNDAPKVRVRLNDALIDLDQPVKVVFNGETVFAGKVERKSSVIETTLKERGDPTNVFSAEIVVEKPAKKSN